MCINSQEEVRGEQRAIKRGIRLAVRGSEPTTFMSKRRHLIRSAITGLNATHERIG